MQNVLSLSVLLQVQFIYFYEISLTQNLDRHRKEKEQTKIK